MLHTIRLRPPTASCGDIKGFPCCTIFPFDLFKLPISFLQEGSKATIAMKVKTGIVSILFIIVFFVFRNPLKSTHSVNVGEVNI